MILFVPVLGSLDLRDRRARARRWPAARAPNGWAWPRAMRWIPCANIAGPRPATTRPPTVHNRMRLGRRGRRARAPRRGRAALRRGRAGHPRRRSGPAARPRQRPDRARPRRRGAAADRQAGRGAGGRAQPGRPRWPRPRAGGARPTTAKPTPPTSGRPDACRAWRPSPATPPSSPAPAAARKPPTTSPRSTAGSARANPQFRREGRAWRDLAAQALARRLDTKFVKHEIRGHEERHDQHGRGDVALGADRGSQGRPQRVQVDRGERLARPQSRPGGDGGGLAAHRGIPRFRPTLRAQRERQDHASTGTKSMTRPFSSIRRPCSTRRTCAIR